MERRHLQRRKTVLNNALGSADYGVAGDRTTYGNPAGRGLLEETHDMKERMKRLEDKLEKMNTNLKTEITDLKTEVTDLKNQVKTLTLASEGYRKIRHRFLEVYRRDVLDDVDKQERK